ncbi:CoA pyrophosphatase [Sphingomonas sp. LY160]|uniref:CoA pyrophosphatase n=1 Tax=Sphingomonas sp. LY160 TaxID=3095342 RepID=UPI002ADED6B9|nr:CoA pyrophosphatase [Sphingomonas sp. LY160]MEA1073026.1 CoA pyrophosphatase [Sphingomonas sp. LY160]
MSGTPSSLVARIERALTTPHTADLLAGDLIEDDAGPLSDAAVLVAITDRPRPGLILTVRRADMRTHAGQVAFPGGRVDAGETVAQAALREAQEELAIDPAQVRLLGQASAYRTVTNYSVTPVVGLVPPDLDLSPEPAEVADWFEAPLDFVLDPANQRRMTAQFRGAERSYYQIDWNDRPIWGATAAMLVNLSRQLA